MDHESDDKDMQKMIDEVAKGKKLQAEKGQILERSSLALSQGEEGKEEEKLQAKQEKEPFHSVKGCWTSEAIASSSKKKRNVHSDNRPLDLYAKIDRTKDWCNSANQIPVGVRVKVFECPASSASAADRNVSGSGTNSWAGMSYTNAATTDYVGSCNIHPSMCGPGSYAPYIPQADDNNPLGNDSNHCGAFGMTNPRKVSEIVDGLSNTLLITESAGRPQVWRKGQQSASAGDKSLNSSNLNACGAWASSNGMGFRGFTADGINQGGPFGVNAANAANGIYSFHPNGANAAMADSSVRFLSDDMNIRALIALVTVNGHEVIDADDKVIQSLLPTGSAQ